MNKKEKLNELKAVLVALTCGAGVLSGCSVTREFEKVNEILPMTKIASDDGIEFYAFDRLSNDEANEIVKMGNMTSNYINYFNGYDYDAFCTPREFESYLNYGELCWDDIRSAVSNNPNFDDVLKQYLYEGINNLETRNYRLSLPVLYYNLSNMKTDFIKDDKSNGLIFTSSSFKPKEHTVFINKTVMNDESFKGIFLHEVLGHGSTCADFVTSDGKNINCGLEFPICIFKNGRPYSYSLLGRCVTEASAEMIRSVATGRRIECFDTSYTFDEYTLLFLCKGMDISVNDIFMDGCKCLYNKATEINVPSSVPVIYNMDLFDNAYFRMQNSSYPFVVKDFYIEYLNDYKKMKENEGLSAENIKEKTDEMLFGYNGYLVPLTSADGYEYFAATPYENKQVIVPQDIDSAVYKKNQK